MFAWLFKGGRREVPKPSEPQSQGQAEVGAKQPVGVQSPTIHLALQYHQAGRLAEADAAYRNVLAADPDNFDALHLSGVVAHQLGQHETAAERILQALARNPSNAPAQNNLGTVFRAQGKLDEALACFQKALALLPDYTDAQTNLCAALAAQGRLDEAVACYKKLLVLKPDFFEAHFNLGLVLKDNGKLDEAVVYFRKALALRPDSAAANVNVGNLLNDEGNPGEAIVCYERAIAIDPGIAEAHLNLGNALKVQDRLDVAIDSYRKTLALRPEWADAHYLLGNALKDRDDQAGMLDCYRRALALNPEYTEARWAYAMGQIPAVYESDADVERARAAFGRELDGLDRWFDKDRLADGFKAVGAMQPFLLAYQEQDNRAVLERYGKLCARIMSAWFEREALSPVEHRHPGTPIRVGVVSQHFFKHSVWNAIVKGWFERIDRERFSLHAFYLGTRQDDETRFAQTHAAHFETGHRELRQWVEAIIGQHLDVLIYPEIGMDPMTARLASLRLAPVQVASWGHPETTGLPTIDHYLSAVDLEPPDAQANYAERLIGLSRLGCFYSAVPITPVDPPLDDFGLDASTPLFLCPGVPFKYAPQHDRVLTEIALRLGRCCFVFFTHRLNRLSEKLQRRLQGAFARQGLDADRFVTFIPWQKSPEFHGWLRRGDVFLDTIGFSGFNTAIQAAQCGIPIVTREGRFMRGRLASGILKRMGLSELVAQIEEDYVALAVKLAQDAGYRQHVQERIVASRHLLFEDDAPIRALETFLEVAVRQQSTGAIMDR